MTRRPLAEVVPPKLAPHACRSICIHFESANALALDLDPQCLSPGCRLMNCWKNTSDSWDGDSYNIAHEITCADLEKVLVLFGTSSLTFMVQRLGTTNFGWAP